MKRNPVIPYAIIAVIGIVAIVFISVLGTHQRDDIKAAEEGGGNTQENGEVSDDPEQIFEANCSACHGSDLSGGMGPDLTKVGADHSAEDIIDIIHNGKGNMPPQKQVVDEEAKTLAEWLSEKK